MKKLDSLDFYSVVKAIYDEETATRSDLELRDDLNVNNLEQVVLKGVEEGYFLIVENSEPEKYELNYGKLIEVWKDIWYDNLDESPPLPESFDSFLENFIKSYLNEEDYSTLEEMLYKEFYLGLSKVSSETRLSNDYRELEDTLSKGFEDKKRPAHHIRNGLRNK